MRPETLPRRADLPKPERCTAHFLCHDIAVSVLSASRETLERAAAEKAEYPSGVFTLRVHVCQSHLDDYEGTNTRLEKAMQRTILVNRRSLIQAELDQIEIKIKELS